ncbi:MAG: hypothetical protein M1829_001205 [Trizodia sp. TS-e1964]|nr:MAG: hypothetical protein M1829_001205 [Trizodia sp. TS-e1964]
MAQVYDRSPSYDRSPPRPIQYTVMPMAASNPYDAVSEPSSPGSPLSYEQPYPNNYNQVQYPMYAYPAAASGYYIQTQPGSIPIEIDDEALLDGGDRRRRRGSRDKDGASHTHSRRRAQNRASQRAFRERKEKHVKDLEQRLSELEEKHKNLAQSYAKLSMANEKLKLDNEKLSNENDALRASSGICRVELDSSADAEADDNESDEIGAPAASFSEMLTKREEDADGVIVGLTAEPLFYAQPGYYFDNQMLAQPGVPDEAMGQACAGPRGDVM